MAAPQPPGILSKTVPADVDEQDGPAFKATRGGTANDLRDLARMGKSQQCESNAEMHRRAICVY